MVVPPALTLVLAGLLPDVAHDAQAVRGWIEIHPERLPFERHSQHVDQRSGGVGRVETIHAAAIADTVQRAVLDAKVDADQPNVRWDESIDIADVPHAARRKLAETDERAIVGQPNDAQELAAPVVAAAAIEVVRRM